MIDCDLRGNVGGFIGVNYCGLSKYFGGKFKRN